MKSLDSAPHLTTRWAKHLGSYHQCSWSRSHCIVDRLAYPGMDNYVGERWPPPHSEAKQHLENINSEYPERFIPDSLLEIE